MKRTKTLICACCGKYTKGRQWWNQDTGYGLCPDCYKKNLKRDIKLYGRDMAMKSMQASYGNYGTHTLDEI